MLKHIFISIYLKHYCHYDKKDVVGNKVLFMDVLMSGLWYWSRFTVEIGSVSTSLEYSNFNVIILRLFCHSFGVTITMHNLDHNCHNSLPFWCVQIIYKYLQNYLCNYRYKIFQRLSVYPCVRLVVLPAADWIRVHYLRSQSPPSLPHTGPGCCLVTQIDNI